MASDAQDTEEQRQLPGQKLQIYSTSRNEISAFWRDKYERDARKYWDVFYKRHQDRFFKDRHYLDKEWGTYFSEGEKGKVVLEVGCGAGNTIFPLVATYPEIFIHACDFSQRAVDLVQTHKDFTNTKVNVFACDLTANDLSKHISPSSVDIVTMIFVLSAVSPEKMPLVLKNIQKVLKPNGYVLFRDYATGDLAQERFTSKDQKISENFYVRGDGTRAFYFSDGFLKSLFKENGFSTEEYGVCCKQVENRSREIIMNRRWVQAAFRFGGANSLCSEQTESMTDPQTEEKAKIEPKSDSKEHEEALVIDMSEGVAAEMFGISSSSDEIVEVKLKDWNFKIKLLSKEFQHTCKSTGLMLWESARLMASLLASNQTIVSGKRVLELGCGSAGICSMIATKSADLVVSTDGDEKALELLSHNVDSNFQSHSRTKLSVQKLQWGNKDDIKSIKQLCNQGFEIIIGTDVTYVAEAIMPLFETAKELLASEGSEDGSKPGLMLCHVLRRVDEPSILSAASHFGFELVDRWPVETTSNRLSSQSIIKSWFPSIQELYNPNSALNILYFQGV